MRALFQYVQGPCRHTQKDQQYRYPTLHLSIAQREQPQLEGLPALRGVPRSMSSGVSKIVSALCTESFGDHSSLQRKSAYSYNNR